MKNAVKYFLQKGLGFDNYLYLFSRYCIRKVSKGKYEKGFRYFISLLPDNGLVLDIGANIGITAVSIAIKHPDIEIHAYEPITENFRTLAKVTKCYRSKNITLFNLALGDKVGQLKMIMPMNGKTKMQGLSKMYDPAHPVKGKVYTVEVRNLDNMYKGKRIAAIKMDVENYEFEVLQGGKEVLTESKPLIYCELWDNNKRIKVIDFMSSLNYYIYTYDEKTDNLLPLMSPYITKDTNFFFISH